MVEIFEAFVSKREYKFFRILIHHTGIVSHIIN